MYFFFSPERVVQLFLLKKVEPSPSHKVIKLLKFDQKITFSPHYDISPKNDAGSRARNT